jgi:23S rRNA (cytosine1962-C5)-methyltransferase
MNGLFLDQRANRLWLQSVSKNKTICNTFSYTGSLTIACASGGAKTTASIDLSKTYSDWCQENIQLNKLNSDYHQVITTDVFEHFDFCKRKNIQYDIIILDPPSFAKKKGGSFSAENNYKDLLVAALLLLSEQGLLVCSTNFSQWSLEEFCSQLLDTAKKYGYKTKLVYQAQADKDFPVHPHWEASNHLKFVGLQKI